MASKLKTLSARRCLIFCEETAVAKTLFDVVDGVLCFLGPRQGKASGPQELSKAIIAVRHFSAPKLVKAIARHWWWLTEHCSSCLQCTAVMPLDAYISPYSHRSRLWGWTSWTNQRRRMATVMWRCFKTS